MALLALLLSLLAFVLSFLAYSKCNKISGVVHIGKDSKGRWFTFGFTDSGRIEGGENRDIMMISDFEHDPLSNSTSL